MTMKNIISIFCTIFAVFFLGSCSKDTADMGNEDSPVLSMTEDTVVMHVGETHRLSLTYSISGVEWSSEHDTIATVDFRGVVTAVKEGKTLVTATREAADKTLETRKASCVVEVKQ